MLILDLVREHFALILREASIQKHDFLAGVNNLFVCGSLMEPAFVASLLGHPAAGAFAVARGYRRVCEEVEGKVIQFMIPEAEGVLPGMVWLDLSDDDVGCFEKFEKAPELRERVDLTVLVGDLSLPAFTYLKKS